MFASSRRRVQRERTAVLENRLERMEALLNSSTGLQTGHGRSPPAPEQLVGIASEMSKSPEFSFAGTFSSRNAAIEDAHAQRPPLRDHSDTRNVTASYAALSHAEHQPDTRLADHAPMQELSRQFNSNSNVRSPWTAVPMSNPSTVLNEEEQIAISPQSVSVGQKIYS